MAQRFDPPDLPDIDQRGRGDVQELAPRQLGLDRRQSLTDQVCLPSNVQSHPTIGCRQPLDIPRPQEEHQPVGVQSDLFLLARLRTETIEYLVWLRRCHPLERDEDLAGEPIIPVGRWGRKRLASRAR